MSVESKYYLALLRPWEMLINLVLYLMGAGLANYLSYAVNWQIFWIGYFLSVTILIGGSALSGCYDQIEKGYSLRRTFSNITPGTPQDTGRKRILNSLLLAIMSFGISLTLFIRFLQTTSIPSEAYLFLLLSIFLMILYSVPPFRLVNRGLGEIIWAAQGAFVFPMVAFLFQGGSLTMVLVFITVPMTLLYIAMEVIRSLRPFSSDPRKYQRSMLVGRVGSDQTLKVTIYLILAAFIIAGLESLLGLSWSVLWRMLLTLPIGVFLVWQLQRIRDGAKPHWLVLELTSIALVVFPAYFLSIWFWAG